jgi:hypothetical protein
MSDGRWYLKITTPDGHSQWAFVDDGAIRGGDFRYAEAFTFSEARQTARRLLEYVPFGTLIEGFACDADEFALPENLRRVINA